MTDEQPRAEVDYVTIALEVDDDVLVDAVRQVLDLPDDAVLSQVEDGTKGRTRMVFECKAWPPKRDRLRGLLGEARASLQAHAGENVSLLEDIGRELGE